jgi:hypothetical protein
MNIHDFIGQIDCQSINVQVVEKIEQSYEVGLNDYIKKVLSINPNGLLFVSDDILRLLSHTEILEAPKDLSVDFIGLKLIPIFDTGDNDYIVFDIENNCWCKFNIVDAIKFKQRQSLNEFFRK